MSKLLTRLKNSVSPKVRRVLSLIRTGPDDFLLDVTGVVHVGANTGQERDKYARHGLAVLWVEPIPDVYAQLTQNIRGYNRQQALQALITDVDDQPCVFHIANNQGESSSIFDLKEHKSVWPEVHYQSEITLQSITLTSLFAREQIDAGRYQAWILDAQGAELLVLKGGLPLLKGVKYIKTEVADFDAYAGGCQLPEMLEFMAQQGFREHYRKKFAQGTQGGGYFDIVFKRIDPVVEGRQ
jgi:FkbM family methyltransferase